MRFLFFPPLLGLASALAKLGAVLVAWITTNGGVVPPKVPMILPGWDYEVFGLFEGHRML